jgi:hypothetical protein
LKDSALGVVEKARRVVSLQIITTLITAGAFYFGQGLVEAQSALYGGFISIASTLLLSRGVQQASDAALENRGKSMRILYVGAAQRFFLIIAAFALGLTVLKLNALALLAGFAIGQFGFFVGVRDLKKHKKGS